MREDKWVCAFRMQMQDIMDLYLNSVGSPIQPEAHLLMAIRWCAGVFGVSKAQFFESLWLVMTSLVQAEVVFRHTVGALD